MKRSRVIVIHTVAVLTGLLMSGWSALAQGPLVPTNAPAIGMKDLGQINGGQPIPSLDPTDTNLNAAPITITEPGRYYLTRELVGNPDNGPAVFITVSDVTLDFHGFRITNEGTSSTNSMYPAVSIADGVEGVTLVDGFIDGRWTGGVVADGPGDTVHRVLMDEVDIRDNVLAPAVRLGDDVCIRDCRLLTVFQDPEPVLVELGDRAQLYRNRIEGRIELGASAEIQECLINHIISLRGGPTNDFRLVRMHNFGAIKNSVLFGSGSVRGFLQTEVTESIVHAEYGTMGGFGPLSVGISGTDGTHVSDCIVDSDGSSVVHQLGVRGGDGSRIERVLVADADAGISVGAGQRGNFVSQCVVPTAFLGDRSTIEESLIVDGGGDGGPAVRIDRFGRVHRVSVPSDKNVQAFGTGLLAGDHSHVTDSKFMGAETGMQIDSHARVENCQIQAFNYFGVDMQDHGRVAGNHISGQDPSPAPLNQTVGILLRGDGSIAEDNVVAGLSTHPLAPGGFYAIAADALGAHNSIFQNRFFEITDGPISNSGPNVAVGKLLAGNGVSKETPTVNYVQP